MNNNESSIHQPYEIIETEETITRYFNPHAKEPTFCTNKPSVNCFSQHKANHQECPERNVYDRGDLKMVLRNCQFQDLHEKFKKLRAVMSELTAKFKEINLMKAQAMSNVYVCVGFDTLDNTDFRPQLQEKDEQSKNGALDCSSRVSIESQTDQIVPESPTRNGDKDSYPKRAEATMLKKSKRLLVNLIDKELQKVQSSEKALIVEKSTVNGPAALHRNAKQLKMECIDKMTGELDVLKDLEGIYGR